MTRISVAPDLPRDLACAHLPLTDLGNAERWRIRYGDDFRFCDKIGWFMWDQRRWRLLSEEKDALPAEVMQSVFSTIRAIRNEAALIAALGCDQAVLADMFGDRYEARANFEWWADMQKQEGWETITKGFAKRYPANEDGERAPEYQKAIDEAVAFIGAAEVHDFAIETAPSKRKLWSGSIAGHAKTSEGAGKLGSVAKLARAFPGIAVDPDAFDSDPMAINVLNGTLRLKRRNVERSAEERAAGKSRWKTEGWKVVRTPHARDDLITKLAPVKYLPNAKSPVWDQFMERMQPDAVMRRFIHQWFGLSMTGDTSEEKLAFFYGSGRNGKGTSVETVAHIAGDYAGSIPIESFLDNGIKRRGDQATPDIARLPGVRFLRVSEPERGARLNEGFIKMITGNDPIDARHLNRGFFTFMADFKMTISGNHKPEIKDTSDGIWRRMQLVPWTQSVPDDEVDLGLKTKLRDEGSGILNRLLEGLCDWRENGLIEPDLVREATAAYRDQSDELGRFLSDVCDVGQDLPHRPMRVGAKQLHDTYTAWCEQCGGAFWKIGGFKKAMIDKGFEQKASDGMKWLGIALRVGVDAEAIREGRWSSPDGNEGRSEGDGPAGGTYDDDYEPGDEF
ncbi:MAG: phage/plasmid primase, P4 family [Pseudomonadota bacterium]